MAKSFRDDGVLRGNVQANPLDARRRRLGFAIWDSERLDHAGLINDIRKYTRPHVVHWLSISRSRDLDRIRWLNVIREEDMPIVRSHRLTVHDSDADGKPDFEYPDDTDESEYWHSPRIDAQLLLSN